MYWTLELAVYLEDAPWPATRDELIDYALRSGAPMEVVENLQDLEEENIQYENIEEIWPDYPIQTVVSLGLGRADKFMQDHNTTYKPSLLSVKEKFDLIVESATDTELVHLTLEDLFTNRNIYYRFNPYLKEQTDLADFRAKILLRYVH